MDAPPSARSAAPSMQLERCRETIFPVRIAIPVNQFMRVSNSAPVLPRLLKCGSRSGAGVREGGDRGCGAWVVGGTGSVGEIAGKTDSLFLMTEASSREIPYDHQRALLLAVSPCGLYFCTHVDVSRVLIFIELPWCLDSIIAQIVGRKIAIAPLAPKVACL